MAEAFGLRQLILFCAPDRNTTARIVDYLSEHGIEELNLTPETVRLSEFLVLAEPLLIDFRQAVIGQRITLGRSSGICTSVEIDFTYKPRVSDPSFPFYATVIFEFQDGRQSRIPAERSKDLFIFQHQN